LAAKNLSTVKSKELLSWKRHKQEIVVLVLWHVQRPEQRLCGVFSRGLMGGWGRKELNEGRVRCSCGQRSQTKGGLKKRALYTYFPLPSAKKGGEEKGRDAILYSHLREERKKRGRRERNKSLVGYLGVRRKRHRKGRGKLEKPPEVQFFPVRSLQAKK